MLADREELRMIAMSNKLRLFFHTAVAIAFASATSFAPAQTYPSKPIRLIVPLAPGSTADIASRFTAQELSKALGQSVVVENKAGAGGTIAMAELARSAPDGYTIGFASQGTRSYSIKGSTPSRVMNRPRTSHRSRCSAACRM